MEDIAWFKELSKADIQVAGGKGASLGEMYNSGLPIPPGFAVTSEAFRKFIVDKKIDKQIFEILDNTNVDDNDELDAASTKVKNIILNTEMGEELKEEIKEAYENLNVDQDVVKAGGQALDIIKSGREQPFVAVRSSATAEDLPSISKDEHVIVKIGNEIVYDRMKNVYDLCEKDSQKKVYVPSLDGNNIKWVEIQELYKHYTKRTKLVRITTKTGRHITITPNHSLIALTDDFELRPASIQEVTKDIRIPVVRYLPHEVENKIEVMDLCEVLKDKELAVKNGRVKIKDFKNWSVQNDFPRFVEIDEEFAYFLGLYASEGSTYKSCVDLSCESKKLAARAKKYLKKLGLYTNKSEYNVRVHNRILTHLLHRLCGKPLEIRGKGRSARIKKAPNMIFNQNKKIIAQFLKGCFDGDGFVSKESIGITSFSPNLIGGMVKLLEILEIKCYLTKEGIEITIPPSEAEKFKHIIGFSEKKNKTKLDNLIKRYKSRKHNDVLDTIPANRTVNSLIEETLKSRLDYKNVDVFICPKCQGYLIKNGKYRKQRFMCIKCGKTLSNTEGLKKGTIITHLNCDRLGRFNKGCAPWNKGNRKKLSVYSISRFKRIAEELKNNELDAIANSNVLWDSIKKIEYIPYSGYVYDFVVPKTQNFCAGVGGIITHNTASFAGQQETFLNIRGVNNLLKAVQRCWASLYTPRAIYYRVKNKFPHDKVLISVIVQKMVKSEKSGVMFSINPSTNNEEEIMIETGWGLGEAVVSGAISPDQYIIDKKTLELKNKIIREQTWMYDLDTNLGHTVKKNVPEYKKNKQKLNDNEIKKLADLAVKIEAHYGNAQDMEYAIEGNQIYIVQSRPVTTLKKAHTDEVEESDAEVILTGLAASPGIGIGPVKIIKGMEELGKVGKGDVLVARMTNPDYVSVMQRASAIVTDAGGITCFSGDTKILTKKGFLTLKEAHNIIKDNTIETLSLDTKSNKVVWKKIIGASKRKGRLNRVQISPSLRSSQNFLNVTLDHKFLTLKNRKITKKTISNILADSEALLIADKIPKINDDIKNLKYPFYLAGAIFSDGNMSINNRGGYTVGFHQTFTPQKINFIDQVINDFESYYQEPLKIYINNDRPNQLQYRCHKKLVYDSLAFLKENIIENILCTDKEHLLEFLGGFIDGDGALGHHQLVITVGEPKKQFLEAIVCACLRLGILPSVTKVKTWYAIQLTEGTQDILTNCKRVQKSYPKKRFGCKKFLSKSIIGDLIDKVNRRGRVKSPFIRKNLMMSDKYLQNRIIPELPEKKAEILSLLNSDFRMWRCKFEENLGYQDVYNLSIDAETELDHNYIVFTSNYSPVIVGNCHAAIVSREMGIPCIVGTEKATQILKEDEIISVDGTHGKVYKGRIKTEEKKEIAEEKISEAVPIETVTEIKVIMDLPNFAEKAAATGAEGVGLLRNNLMLAKHGEHPSHIVKTGRKDELVEMIVEDVSKIAEAFKGKPVWYRTFDAPTDEYRGMKGGEDEPVEQNPMMGWRSIRRSLEEVDLLKAEFEAIKKIHEKGLTTVGVMIPLVISVEEIKKAKEILKETGLEPRKDIEFGIMVETPAAVQIIKEICEEGIDFISFGTNDLTQFTLAVDRDNARVAKLYNEKHPAVLRQIKHVIDTCKKYNVKTSICGQAGSDPEMAEILVRMGIDSITANVDAVHNIRGIVAKIEKKLLLSAARKDFKI